MNRHIHILGASGSGTSTLGRALAETLSVAHFDTDDFFWLPTDPKFEVVRSVEQRQRILRDALHGTDDWVLSGSLCGWGDFTIPLFSCVVYLFLPSEIRMERLRSRELQRYGPSIVETSHPRNRAYRDFMDWAARYDTGGVEMRSKACHEAWLQNLLVPVIRLEGDMTLQQKISRIMTSGSILGRDD